MLRARASFRCQSNLYKIPQVAQTAHVEAPVIFVKRTAEPQAATRTKRDDAHGGATTHDAHATPAKASDAR